MKKAKLINNQFTQLDKSNWQRRYEKMQKLVAEVNQLADQIITLEAQKIPILDEIAETRELMVQECVHPKEFLIEQDDYITCKFCDRKFSVN